MTFGPDQKMRAQTRPDQTLYLKLLPESLLGLFAVVCHFVQLLDPVLDVGCVDARGVEGLGERSEKLASVQRANSQKRTSLEDQQMQVNPQPMRSAAHPFI